MEWQTIPVDLGGLDTKTDEKQVIPGKLIRLENGTFSRFGAISKRNGYRKLSQRISENFALSGEQSPMLEAGVGLIANGPELILFDKDKFYTYSPGQGDWRDLNFNQSSATALARVPHLHETDNPITGAGVSFDSPTPPVYIQPVTDGDVAVCNGLVAYVWKTYGYAVPATSQAYVSVVDLKTGAPIQVAWNFKTIDGNEHGPRVIAMNDRYLLAFAIQGNTLAMSQFDTQGLRQARTFPSPAASIAVATNANAFGTFDVVPLRGQNKAAIIYHTNVPDIRIIIVDQSGTVVAGPVTIAQTIVSGSHLAIAQSAAGDLYAMWIQNATNSITVHAITSAAGAIFGPTALTADAGASRFAIVESPTTPDTMLCYWGTVASNQYATKRSHFTKTATIGAIYTMFNGCQPCSRPFTYGTTAYMLAERFAPTTTATAAQPAYWLIGDDCDTSNPTLPVFAVVGKALQDKAFDYRQTGATYTPVHTSVASLGNGQFLMARPAVFPSGLMLDSTHLVPSMASIKFDFKAGRPSAAVLGRNLHFTGNILREYDGNMLCENNFHTYPEQVTATTAGAGGSLADGTYQFSVVWAWFDARGQLHRSAPSTPLSVVVAAGTGTAKITVTIPLYHLAKRNNAFALVYATTAGGTLFYETTALYMGVPPVAQTISLDFTTVTGLTSKRLLYTTGGTVRNRPPPRARYMVAVGKRLFVYAGDDLIWYTRELVDGEPAQFSDSLTKKLHQRGGEVTALAEMDGAIIVFKETGIQYFTGSGPTDTGTQNNFSEVRAVATDVGAAADSPTVLTDQGIFFISPRGICLLTRSMQVTYVGMPVDAYAGLTITSAVLRSGKNQIIFGTSDGADLVYDYLAQQWWTNTFVANNSSAAATEWNSRHAILRPDGQVFVEEPGYYRDENQPIKMVIGTSWLKFGGIQGFQRVRRLIVLGAKVKNKIKVRLYYDYKSTADEEFTFTAGDAIPVSDTVYQFRHHLQRHSCEAIRVEIEDDGTGELTDQFAITNLSFEVGVARGAFRAPTYKTV